MTGAAGILLSVPAVEISKEVARGFRQRVHKEGSQFVRVCEELGVQPDLDCLKLIQRWVTPSWVPKRFDTFFFLACPERASISGAEADGGAPPHLPWAELS